MLVRGLHGHFSSRAAACRGMPFCPCYLRVDLRPGPGLCCLCVGANTPDGQGHPPAAGSRQDLRCAPRGPGIRPAAIDTPVPAGRRYPTATQRTGRPAGAGPHARLGRTTARTRRDASSRQHTGPPPGGNARCAYCPSPATTHSKEKRLLSIPKHPYRRLRAALPLAGRWACQRPDFPVMRGDAAKSPASRAAPSAAMAAEDGQLRWRWLPTGSSARLLPRAGVRLRPASSCGIAQR